MRMRLLVSALVCVAACDEIPKKVAVQTDSASVPAPVAPDQLSKYPAAREVIPGFFEVFRSAERDTTVRASTTHPIIYLPRSRWADTLNVIRVHQGMDERSPVVAILGVRKNGNRWERIFAATKSPVVGSDVRVSEDEWGFYTGGMEPYEGWYTVWYGFAGQGELLGHVKADTTLYEIEPPRVDTSAAAQRIIARFAALIPDTLLVRHGACPFECCIYRDWTTRDPRPVFARPRTNGPPIFTLPAGERFQAKTGTVYITGLAVVAVGDTIAGNDGGALLPGDTVVVLDSEGEGYYDVWKSGGGVLSVPIEWDQREWDERGHRTFGAHGMQWWINIKTKSGQEGWMERGEGIIEGTDRCE